MARTKKSLVIESVEQNEVVVKPTGSITEFELNAEIAAGTLTSNAKELRQKIESELKNYTVEKYIDSPDAAKSDKALLNKVRDSVSEKRKEITKAWNKPLDEFLAEMKGLESTIQNASNQINEIVKTAENQEKESKRKQIESYWSTLNFTLVTLDRIFNPKWLNKTYKLEQIMLDCEAITEKISGELSTIKSMSGDDIDILQSFYLETLDLNQTLQKGNQLRANKERLQEEEKKQAAVNVVTELAKAEIVEVEEAKKVIDVISNNNEPEMTFTLRLTGPKSKLIELRKYIDNNGIKYEKL